MSFAAAGLLLLVALVLIVSLLGTPGSAYGAGRAVGTLLFPLCVAALIVGFISRGSASRWRWWRYLLVVLGISLGLFVVIAFGRVAQGGS